MTTDAENRSQGPYSARHRSPATARRMIEEGARAALRDLRAVTPYDPGRPCTIEVELGTSDAVEQFIHHPLVEVVDGRTVRSHAEDWWSAWRQFYFSYSWPD